MGKITCPECSFENPSWAQECQLCGASLSGDVDPDPIDEVFDPDLLDRQVVA